MTVFAPEQIRRLIVLLVLLTLTLIGTASAGAQPAPWRVDFDVSFSSMSGNKDMALWNSSFRLRHTQPDLISFDLKLNGRYGVGETDDGIRERTQEFYRSDFRIDGLPGGFGPYVETRVQHDPFKGRKLMVNSGAGGRYEVEWSDNGRATTRLAMLHSYDERFSGETVQTARWNMEMDGRQELGEIVVLTHSTKFQPLHNQINDHLLSLDTRVNIRMTTRLSFLLRHEFERDTDPPSSRASRDDTVVTAGVSVSL